MSTLVHTRCLLCSGDRLQPLKGFESNFLTTCTECGFVFCGRKPTSAELAEHYGKYPRAASISLITKQRYETLLDGFEPYRRTNQILDLGCGDGHFLESAKRRNWTVHGTEFTKEAISICEGKGIVMKPGPLASTDFPGDYFDVITSFEVIEHLDDPGTDVEVAARFLRANGLFYVTTPNFNSISRYYLGNRWSVIEYPEHLCYFTPSTLRALFRSKGFKDLKITTTGISFNRWQAAGSARPSEEPLREAIESHVLLRKAKQLANIVLDSLGKGDSMKGYFVKT